MESKDHAPVIVVTEIGNCINTWNEVLLGIEEEGIPFHIQQIPSGEVIDSTWQAARQSPLLVGIACDREKLIVHYKNLPTSAPLFTLMYQQDNHARRSIGNNAARLVKGIPFREGHS
ncbi:glycerol dehydratase reactivase beta/small subunit family protein [Escherichia albertii NBRC 107761 = DSM 17582]|uniref:Propanediol utilization protein PduH n=1 Tax=Escherichia albertii (strain TW07627) TaxID=502347 RepID=A0ABC9NJF0_ESCAT|nr:glycerol dehydratase reactivase beta/small subunit family protein [Escherichia albertii]EDS90321.1 propanediol utilization protein PduH [Escherichia albertii TW07627]EKG0289523.1 glycerol dehydratase reactivase beta/small subunit family protein [Escherichia albertii]MCJ2197429.1 glycerol dehydratase reactivase beta/small subunit family protein [Escherichia albertii NBRC 107761 = DSM 17582]MCZ8797111.1 glycerol dehydratase reactivase beta/small subunit family protein [Escherichia albertii]GA